jgi:hypothetical protein
MSFLKKMFCDESGQPSSNRIFGGIVIIAGLVLAFLKFNSSLEVISAGAAILGIGQIKSAIVSTKNKKSESGSG